MKVNLQKKRLKKLPRKKRSSPKKEEPLPVCSSYDEIKDLSQHVQDSVSSRELGPPPKPSWGRKLAQSIPQDAQDLPLKELGKIHGATVNWESFAQGRVGIVEHRMIILRSVRKRMLDDARFLASSSTPAWKVEAEMEHENEEFAQLTKDVMKAEAELMVLKGVLDGYRRRAEFLSRELTRRQTEYEHSGRVT